MIAFPPEWQKTTLNTPMTGDILGADLDIDVKEVVDAMPKMMQLPNGMIVPEKLFVGELHGGLEIEITLMSKQESRKTEQQLAAQQRERKEEKTRQRHEALRQKREEERKTQPELFDLGE